MCLPLILSVIFTLVLNPIDTAKILAVFPVPSISHQVVFRPLTQELARRGHEVTVLTPDPVFKKGNAPPNLKEIDVHDISYKFWVENFMSASKGNKGDISNQMEIILDTFAVVFDAQLQTKEMKEILSYSPDHYDLLLLEACVRPTLGLTYRFKAPAVFVSSFGAAPGNFEIIGASEHPILYPNIIHQRIYNLSLWDKISELYNHYQTMKIYERNAITENNILRKNFGPEIPTIDVLSNNVDMLLLNSNPVFEGIRPVPPNVVYMGGLHQNPVKPLPEDLKKYLDSSKNGVIYVSFGTNVDSKFLPVERVQTLVRVFSKLPYNVLFKWDDEELPGRTNNIRISKWLPQSDLLRHPNIKLFITQGGLQSTDEAITAGVPLIGIPMLADQWYNVEQYVYHKIGAQLDLETLTEEQFLNAINTVVGDKSYRKNIVKLRELMTDQPMKPLERAMWWLEHLLRHGGAKHLRSPAANISWTDYLELELVFILLGALLIAIFALVIILRLLYKIILSIFGDISVKKKFN